MLISFFAFEDITLVRLMGEREELLLLPEETFIDTTETTQ